MILILWFVKGMAQFCSVSPSTTSRVSLWPRSESDGAEEERRAVADSEGRTETQEPIKIIHDYQLLQPWVKLSHPQSVRSEVEHGFCCGSVGGFLFSCFIFYFFSLSVLFLNGGAGMEADVFCLTWCTFYCTIFLLRWSWWKLCLKHSESYHFLNIVKNTQGRLAGPDLTISFGDSIYCCGHVFLWLRVDDCIIWNYLPIFNWNYSFHSYHYSSGLFLCVQNKFY